MRIVHLIFLTFFLIVPSYTLAGNSTEEKDFTPNHPSKRQKVSKEREHSFVALLSTNDDPNYKKLYTSFHSFLNPPDFLSLRETSKEIKRIIDEIYFYPIEDSPLFICPFSSEISGSTIRAHIYKFLDMAQQRIIIASDQLTDFDLVEKLKRLQQQRGELQVDLVCGQNPNMRPELRQNIEESNITFQEVVHKHSKMHNKFILIDNFGILTGSPNATTSAYERNIESFVAIRNPLVNRLYAAYHTYLTSRADPFDATTPEFNQVAQLMDHLNALPNCPLNVCLAPIRDIRPFVKERITDSNIIAISMFLISHAKTNKEDDILSTLQKETKNKGSLATMKIDGNRYGALSYMKTAVRTFDHNPNTHVYSVNLKNGTFHDKLIILFKNEIPIVIIGSAGFTDNVQDNFNQENMIAISGRPYIHAFFQAHFDAVNVQNQKVGELKKVNK